jgi:hypothetical protein
MLRRHRPPSPIAPASLPGIPLGRRLAGDRVLPQTPSGQLLWPYDLMPRHALILGASGTGKTETSLRIAYHLAQHTDALVFYLDAKGDRHTARRFCALMSSAGRTPRVFPNQPIDAWRGDWRAIVNRLLEVIQFALDGPASYYRDIAKTALQLACRHPDGPPRCSAELLFRLDYEHLLNAHGPNSAVLSLPRDQVSQVRLRYHAFFGQLGAQLDGNWSFDDADTSYLLLDSVALGEDTAGAASLLFTDFAHFFSRRKPRERLCAMICDEFAAISTASDLALKVEQARSFNTSLILVPQTVSAIGTERQCDRILGSVETLIAHAVNEPERLAQLAGTRNVLELSHRFEGTVANGEGIARLEQRPRLRPDRLRGLAIGSAWVIRRGRAARVAIDPAPNPLGESLPPAQPIDPPMQVVETDLAKQIAYLDEED